MEKQWQGAARGESVRNIHPEFPYAPDDWSPNAARVQAEQEGLVMNDDRWELVRALQSFYARNRDSVPQLPDIKAALEEKFHHRGGNKFLYELLPGGPVAQGCRLAGLKAPVSAIDKGFGSVA